MAQDTISFMKENIQGILTGAAIGYLVYKFFVPQTTDFSIIQTSYGLIDGLVGVGIKGTVELAKTKLMWTYIILGALIGLLIDANNKEGFLRKVF